MRLTLKRKSYTYYDDVDDLKRMRDSDILAEKPKKGGIWKGAVGNMAAGATITGLGAGTVAGLNGLTRKGSRLASAGHGFMKGGKYGAGVGAAVGLGLTALKNRKQAQENSDYNRRLTYAQRQAKRREKRDWRTNMIQRDGYSY